MRTTAKLGLLVLVLAGIGVNFLTLPGALPGFDEVRAGFTASDAVLVDRHGQVIQELRLDHTARRLSWVQLKDVSPALQAAVIAAEDKRFYNHTGADWASLAAALSGMLTTPRGASTITMQLVSRLRPELQPAAGRRSPWQKLRQIRGARALERRWSKARILEAYLNLVSFRGELQGVAAASAGLFGKRPHGLDDIEGVILASLIRSPNARPAQVAARAALLAQSMRLPHEARLVAAKAGEALARPYAIQPELALAPHVALRLAREAAAGRATGRLESTLDGALQRFAADSLRRHLASIASQNVRDGAVLVVDNATHEVLAYVGNTGEPGPARHVDGVRSPRQAGSTLKPILYAVAFEKRLLTPASLLEDSPLEVPVPGGVYRPRNYDNQFRGLVTARTALASSLNVPAVKTLALTGIDAVVERLGLMGIGGLRSPDYYGPSLALGSVDVTLWDLVTAYGVLASGGVASPLRLSAVEAAGQGRPVLSPEAVFLVSDILSDRESRSATFTLESPLSTRFWSAVKTGTSKDMRDNWCVGYSDRFTVGVWVGNFNGEPMWNVSGVAGAAPVWVEVMNRLHRDRPVSSPQPPPGIIRRDVRLVSGQNRREWFVRGTETGAVLPASSAAPARIVQPAGGTVVALDPDIPAGQQRVFFEANTSDNAAQWLLDGRALGPAHPVYLWAPRPGKHRLALVDGHNRIQDAVLFEVRGEDTRQVP